MLKLRYAVLAAVAALGITAGVTAKSADAEAQTGKTVSIFHTPDSRPCAFFQLHGVPQADGVNPGNPWFGLPKSANGYNEMVSALILSRTKGVPLNVYTDGTMSCGHATVYAITF